MALTTRLTALQRVAPMIGGYQGNITSGGATSAVLAGLVGVTNDDDLNDDLLVMPDAATDADQARIITDWAGSTGTATFGTRADTTYTSETYFTVPKNTFTLQELRQAVSTVLRNTKRTYRYIVPTRDDERHYALPDLSWLRNKNDVAGVLYRAAPDMLFNSDFSYWHSGTTSAPDGWTLAGSGATVARQTTFASYGAYEVALTRVGADATLTQNVPYQLAKQLLDGLVTVTLKVRCTASVATRGRVGINDGNDTTWSSYHSGDGEPEDLTVSRTLTADASRVQAVLSCDTGNATVSFDFAPFVEGAAVGDDLWKGGNAAFIEREVTHQLWDIGSASPVLVLPHAYGRKGQFIVVTNRLYADLTTDSASTECPEDVLEAGILYRLGLLRKPSMDAAWLKQLVDTWGPVYTHLANNLITRPIEPTLRQIRVVGA